MNDPRKSTLHDSVWAQIENEKLRKRVIDENEAAKEFDSNFPTEDVIPAAGEVWGDSEC